MPGFSGQGIITIAQRLPSGLPGIWRDIGNASICKATLTTDTVERKESRTGQRLPNRRLTKGVGGKLQLVFDEFNNQNFALCILGALTSVAAGTAVAGYPLPSGAAVGDILSLPAKNVTAVAVKDSTSGTAKTLTVNQHFALDPLAGEIKLLDITTGGAYTQPFKADFTPGPVDVLGAFKNAAAEYYVRCNGVNTDDGNARGIFEVFRVRFDPTKAIDLISDDYMDWDIDGSILADPNRATADPDGVYLSFTKAKAS